MKIVFCLPGNNFSDAWVHSWIDTINVMSQNGIEWAYNIVYDPVVYYTRNRLLAGNNVDGRSQKPFGGKLDYDYLIWIDSDMVWRGQDVLNLISHNLDIVSGCYLMADNTRYPIVETLDYNRLSENGVFDFMTRDQLSTKKSLFEANYVGFGFLAVKYGIFEKMEYPWFRPEWVNTDTFCDFCSEDVGACWTFSKFGIKVYVDPNIIVGHQKSFILK